MVPFSCVEVGQIRTGTNESTWKKGTDTFAFEAQCSIMYLMD